MFPQAHFCAANSPLKKSCCKIFRNLEITDLNNSGPKLQVDRLVYPKEGIYFFQIRPKTSQVSAAADS